MRATRPVGNTSISPEHRQLALLAKRFLKKRTPGRRAFREYLEDVEIWSTAVRRSPRLALRNGEVIPAELTMRHSALFAREYPIAWIDDDALERAAPCCDAFATVLTTPFWIPLIFAPRSRRRSRSTDFASVLEHETVHVNQALTGLVLPDEAAKTSEELLQQYYTHFEIEFEAHSIQGVYCPMRQEDRLGLSITRWCLLRAHTPAMEQILREAAAGTVEETLLPKFLEQVPESAIDKLTALGCTPSDIEWFKERWMGDVACAFIEMCNQHPSTPGTLPNVLRALKLWFRTQPDLRAD